MESSTLLLTGLGIASLLLLARQVVASRSFLSKEQATSLLEQGAMILDVRTPEEFAQGHAPGSRNIPLDRLGSGLQGLDRGQPILVCCASGARSSAAKGILERAGFAQVHNAGPWRRLLRA